MRRILQEQQQIIQQYQQQHQHQNPGMALISEGTLNLLHFSIKNALETVPNFDRENILFVYILLRVVRKHSAHMIAPTQETNLVRAIRNKLKNAHINSRENF